VRSAGLVAFAVLLIAAACSSGCLVLALQPAYDAGSVVFDEALIGRWANTDDGTKATVERGEWRSYKITYIDRSATRSFQGNLTRLDSATFLDLTEMRGADPGPYLVPVHGLFRVTIEGDRLSAAMLDYAWFTRAVLQKRLGTLSTAIDDRRNAVITAPTSDLRRWLAHAPDEAFAAPITFVRQP
jgi:hypothetical protein